MTPYVTPQERRRRAAAERRARYAASPSVRPAAVAGPTTIHQFDLEER